MLVLLSLFACGADKDATVDSAVGPTYHADVAPILRERCEGCHSDGLSGPFLLNSFEDVQVIGEAVADSVETRRMPPWLADDSCNSYKDSRWMSEDEIAVIRAWVDGGMPEGDPARALEPFAPEVVSLDDATHSVAISTPYAPDFEGQQDDYRCFVVDPEVLADGYVTAFEVVPGDPEIVHHVILYLPTSEGAADAARRYEASDEDPGYQCFGDARVDSTMLAAWAPGTNVQRYPEGTGIAVAAGTPIVIQMHYNNAGGPDAVDATEVRLKIEEEVDEELFSFFWVNGSLRIPGGEEAHVEESRQRVSSFVGDIDGQLMLHTIGPHMHSLGSQLNSTLIRADGSEACMLEVPRWDFNWQMSYDLTEPIAISPDDTISLTCTFDSSDRDGVTRWGDGTGDEMCLTTMFVTFEEG